MPWYRTGTVSVTNNSTTVTGTGTNFSANSRVGDAFQGPDGRWYEVANIASTTVISILPAYQGTTASAGVYGLAPMQGYVKDSADKLRALTEGMRDITGDVGQARVYAESAQTSATTATQKATEASSSAAQAAASVGDKQPLNANLTAISNSILTANKILYATGAETFGVTDFTTYARTLVAAIGPAAARTTLQLVKTTTSTDTTSGSVLKVGDFGLGASGVTITTAVLNSNGCPSGLYRVDVDTTDNGLPTGAYSVLSIAMNSTGACHQTAINNTTKILYRRVSVTGTWEVAIPAVMVGATASTAGTAGLVPAPSASSVVRYLSDSGDWREIAELDAKYVTKDSDTGAANIPVGTSVQRPAVPAAGMFRYNSSLSRFERRNATAWFSHGDMDGPLNEAPVTFLNSASVSIIYLYNNTITITGTTTITSLGTAANSGIVRRLVFTTALQITHNATSLILPGAADITTAAGDVAEFVSLGSGNWKCLYYTRANALPVMATDKSQCTAWVNFNGTGTVAIRDSFGVTSITDNAVGNYTLNFSVAMANTNYSLSGTARTTSSVSTGGSLALLEGDTKTTSSVQVRVNGNDANGNSVRDASEVNVNVFGGK